MAQMIVGSVPGEESIQVLNGMVDMLLGGDFRVVAVVEVLAVLFCAILSHLCGSEHGVQRQKVKSIGGCGLLAAMLILDNGCIRLNALNHLTHSDSSISSMGLMGLLT